MYLTLYDGTLHSMKLFDAMKSNTTIPMSRLAALSSAARVDGISHMKNILAGETFRKQYIPVKVK